MSKELMSPFKALSKLTYRANNDNDTTVEDCLEWYNIVATALRALDIIKKKGNFISLEYDKYDDKYYIYDNEYYMHNEITKEEYDLLREVLYEMR